MNRRMLLLKRLSEIVSPFPFTEAFPASIRYCSDEHQFSHGCVSAVTSSA